MYSKDYLLAKASYLEKQIKAIPIISLGKHQGNPIVNVYTQEGKRSRLRITTKKGREYFHKYEIRQRLEEELKSLYRQHKELKNDTKLQIKAVRLLPYSIKEHLVPDSNPKPKPGDYWFKNIQMRSRLELITAEVIDSMGLEFMYEAAIVINGHTYCPDFIVFLPELGCCFIIECLGMTEKLDYLYDNNNKIIDFIYVGLQPNINYLLFCAKSDFVPNPNQMKYEIAYLINNLARMIVEHEVFK